MATDSKLHHYVPRFLLSRFSSEPQAENPSFWRLDKRTGRPSRTSVRNEAAISHYNKLRDMENLPQDFVECTLGMVEGRAAAIVADLVEGRSIRPEERLEMALFVYLQYHRTPRGRQWFTYTFEQVRTLDAMQRVLDPDHVQAFYRSQGEEISREEAERRGRELFDELDAGKLELKAQHNHAIAAMFMFVEATTPAIAGRMSWLVVHAPPEREFIISDHPVLIVDPAAGPNRGAGWLSSPDAEATLPLDARAALVLSPGPPDLEHVDADRELVEEINLRTYASAEWGIYGRTQGVLQQVREQAKRQKQRVAGLAPVPPMIHIQEYVEGQEAPFRVQRIRPTGEVKRRQHWPRWEESGSRKSLRRDPPNPEEKHS